jgi:hypothetical protein
MLDEQARKLEKRCSAARLIGDARSFATGFGSKADGTGSRKTASYRLTVEAWNKARRNNRIDIGGWDTASTAVPRGPGPEPEWRGTVAYAPT